MIWWLQTGAGGGGGQAEKRDRYAGEEPLHLQLHLPPLTGTLGSERCSMLRHTNQRVLSCNIVFYPSASSGRRWTA